MFSAVVFTPGRTGSWLICHNLAAVFGTQVHESTFYDGSGGIVHCHDPLWHNADTDAVCVISRRRDRFAAIMSTLVGKITSEWTHYKDKDRNRDPVTVPESALIDCYWHMRCFYDVVSDAAFKKRIDIVYEDLMQDPTYLFFQFGLQRPTDYTLTRKAPHRWQELIANHENLRATFNALEQMPLTEDLITSFKQSVRDDLQSIYVANHNR